MKGTDEMSLLESKKDAFKKQGYVIFRKKEVASILCIEEKDIDKGVDEFDKIISESNLLSEAKFESRYNGWGEIEVFNSDRWKNRQNASELIKNFSSLANELYSPLADGLKLKDIDWVQLAFRKEGQAVKDFNAHIDGGGDYRSDANAEISRMAMIGGILLSDCLCKDQGETVLWAGSHRKMKKYCKTLEKLSIRDARIAKYDFKNYYRKHLKKSNKSIEDMATRVNGEKGDFFFFHYATLHGTSGNKNVDIRKTLFHRFKVCEINKADATKCIESSPAKVGKDDGMEIYTNLFPWNAINSETEVVMPSVA